ncbi:MAG: low-specificity L-threonine aldolase [Anaerolineae bacterium]
MSVMDSVDLRSDTVTWPTPAMRAAMASAEVGDDVWGDDPTVKRLEKLSAERAGMEAALFVPSGTMGNLIAALVHCNRGEALILGDQSHTYVWEAGGASTLGGVVMHPVPNMPDGTLRLPTVEAAIRPDDPHFPRTRAIFLENTHNACGGVIIPPAYFAQVREIARRHGLAIHLDGARIFNAAVALGCSIKEFTQHVDSLMFCLSKGLCAPIGSLLCGSEEFIRQARRMRKVLGGGMRQVGVVAAAGIVALEEMVDRLAEDHRHARLLAEELAQLPGVFINLESVQTNIIYFRLSESIPLEPSELVGRLESEYRVRIGWMKEREFRLVTHYWITPAKVEQAVRAFRAILGQG